LTLAEAMAIGKPVIGTGYSGNLDFMNVANRREGSERCTESAARDDVLGALAPGDGEGCGRRSKGPGHARQRYTWVG